MAETMIERARLAMRAKWEGEAGPADGPWPLSDKEADAIIRTIMESMREPTAAMMERGGRALDYPSVYMGGASQRSVKSAGWAWESMIDAALTEGHGDE